MATEPLVVTLSIDNATQERFDTERARFFPPGRTAVGAHITLFHAVPGALVEQVHADLTEQCGPAFDLHVPRIMPLGRGAAYAIESTELRERHRALQQRWRDHLTAQDRQGLRAHVTVQNKVTPEQARATVSALQRDFAPFDVRATGFVLWRYVGGPWDELDRFPFPDGPDLD